MYSRVRVVRFGLLLVGLQAFSCSGSQGGPGAEPGAATKLVSAAQGGALELGLARLEVPAGALARDTTLTVTSAAPGSTLPDASTIKGLVYDFGPDGTTFSTGATLSLPVAGSPAQGESAVISWLDEPSNSWKDLTTTVTSGVASARVAHFTRFVLRFVRGQPNPNKPVSRIELSHSLLALEYDQIQEVTARVLAADGTTIAGKTVVWLSDTPKNVTVDGADVTQGPRVQIQGIGRGGATVFATVPGEPSVKSTVLVSVPYAPVAEVVVAAPPQSLTPGARVQLTVKVLDPRGADITPARIFSWSSSNPAIASVTDEGLVTAYRPGDVTITASCEDVSPGGRRQVTGARGLTVDPPDGYFVWGFVRGPSTRCGLSSFTAEHKADYARTVTTKYDQTESAALVSEVEAQMKAEFPGDFWRRVSVEREASHMVFGLVSVTSPQMPLCNMVRMVHGKGWTEDDARADAMRALPEFTNASEVVPGSFTFLKHIPLR